MHLIFASAVFERTPALSYWAGVVMPGSTRYPVLARTGGRQSCHAAQ